MIRRSARIAAESARGDSSRWSTGSLVELHSEIVGDVLHRLLSGGECPGDDDHVVSSLRLLVGELERVESCTADVEPGDHVHDPHDGSGCGPGGGSKGTAQRPSRRS